jgi:hypothetical protein
MLPPNDPIDRNDAPASCDDHPVACVARRGDRCFQLVLRERVRFRQLADVAAGVRWAAKVRLDGSSASIYRELRALDEPHFR